MEYAELPKVAKETCYEHDWQGIGECPECVDAWAEASPSSSQTRPSLKEVTRRYKYLTATPGCGIIEVWSGNQPQPR